MTRILFGISRSYFLHPYFEFEFFKSSNAPLCCLFEVLIGICILSQKRVTTIFEVSTSSWSLFGILGMISKLFSICVGSFHFLILYHTVCFSTTYDNYPCSDIYLIWQYGLWSFQTGGTKLERIRDVCKLLRLPVSPILTIQKFPLDMLTLRQRSF